MSGQRSQGPSDQSQGRPPGRGKGARRASSATATGPAKRRGRWSSGWRLWFKRAVLLGLAMVAAGLALFAVAYAKVDIPDPNEGFESQTSYVYYSDGKSVLGKFAEQDRTSVTLDEVPQHVQDAITAAEDRSFWTNKGLDPKGILRAAFNNASGGSMQGASTITQQYVKIFYLSQERTWQRKAKEAILSLKIHRELSKREILEGYLNTIYFGRGAYGIEAASRAYFNKSAGDLDVREGAALAAIVNSPNNYDPADGKAAKRALLSRYRYVISGMESEGTLPAELVGSPQADKLPPFPELQVQSQYGGQRGHVLKMVRQELRSLGYSDAEIDGGGLRITTTFNRKAMAAAAAGVFEERPALKGLHVAVASVDPRTGALRGMYAGQDYLQSQLNWATAGGAPGSTFKPFSLATALDYGYSLKSVFNGDSPLEVSGTEFNNQGEGGGTSYGPVSLLEATEKSINTAYVEMVDSMDGGPGLVVDTAADLGIPRDAPGLEENLSMVLGSATVSPVDMANAYGTIADAGKAKKVYVIESVRRADEEEADYKHSSKTDQVISEEVAADTSYALQQVAKVGTGTNADVIGRPIAGKTGTATDDEGRVRSSWFVGYTPQLSTAVMYVRGNGNEPMDGWIDTFYGGEHPARTWAGVMSRALEGTDVIDFPPPANIEQTAEGHEPTPTPSPSPTKASPTQEPETQAPTEEPSEEPSVEPTEEPTTAPPTTPPPSTEPPPPTEEPTDGGVIGGGDSQGPQPDATGPPPEDQKPDPGSPGERRSAPARVESTED